MGSVSGRLADGFGADADHRENAADIDSCAAAGFTFYTIDPSEHVDNEANTAPVDVLKAKIDGDAVGRIGD